MESLEKRLQYTFKNRALLSEALNHSSYANEHRNASGTDDAGRNGKSSAGG